MTAASLRPTTRPATFLTTLALVAASILVSAQAAFANLECRHLFRSQDEINRFLIRSSTSASSQSTPTESAPTLDRSVPRLVTSFAPFDNPGHREIRRLQPDRNEPPEITFADIARDTERFQRFIPRVYARIGSERIGDELATLSTFLNRFGGHALSVGNYGAIEGIPTIDAVHFPRNANEPPINVSIKSSTSRERTNGYNFVNNAITKARNSLRDNYGRVGLTRLLGSRINLADDLFHILGYNFSGDRPAILVLDLSLEIWQSPSLERASDVARYRLLKGESPTDILLTVDDRRVDAAENASHNRVNLSALRRDIRAATRSKGVAAYRNGAEFSEYRIMFANANLVVTAKDIQIDPID